VTESLIKSGNVTDQTMIAARLHPNGGLTVDRICAPEAPAPGEVQLAVEAVGVCGSDLHAYRGGDTGNLKSGEPHVPGHEFVGVVEHVHSDAMAGDGATLQTGERVAVDPAQPCEQCIWCERGETNLCPDVKFLGVPPYDGALCERIVVPAGQCYPVARSMEPETAALLEPLGVALHAVDLTRITDQAVVILGAGPIGLLILQVARLLNPRWIAVIEPLSWRRELAAGLGADTTIDPQAVEPVDAIDRATAGRGADRAIEAASSGDAIQQAAQMLTPGGHLTIVGIDEGDQLVMRHSTVRRKGLTIRLVRRMPAILPRAMELLQAGSVDVATLISHRAPLARARQIFEINSQYRDGIVKAIIEPGA